jgi:phospholipid transport system substrate-binding protein
MRHLFYLLVFSLTLFVAPLARAADGEGTATVRAANQTLQSLLKKGATPGSAEEKKLTEELNTKLRGFLDVDELGKRALGENAKKFSAEELAEFTKLLREIVEANYLRALRSQLEYEVSYLKESNEGKTLRVTTTVKTKGSKDGPARTIDIDYVLHKDGASLRVFDLVTDGIGLVENYKSQFNRVIAKEGAAGLLGRMRKKAVKE